MNTVQSYESMWTTFKLNEGKCRPLDENIAWWEERKQIVSFPKEVGHKWQYMMWTL